MSGVSRTVQGQSSAVQNRATRRLPEAPVGQLQLSEAVATHLRERIISGAIKMGEFLRIDAIAKEMKISTTPVREGLLMLQSESWVRLIPRRGFVVNRFSHEDIIDVFWAQAQIAAELVVRAMQHMSKADIDRLAAIQLAHEGAFERDDPQVARLGHHFHRAINQAAQSPRLALLLGSLTKQLPNRFYASIEGQLKNAVEYHPLILEAIRTGDAARARTLMREHILSGGRLLVDMLDRQAREAALPAKPARRKRHSGQPPSEGGR